METETETETGRRGPESDRVKVRRGKDRAVYEPSEIRAILAAGMVAHVGATSPQGPIVMPMAYGIDETNIYLHGSLANAVIADAVSAGICVTVTLVDGLVVSRTPFHNSMNYRSVVIRGDAVPVLDQDAKVRALKVINDHIAPLWDIARPPSESDFKKTAVIALSLREASAKVRTGDPVDEAEDISGPWWAGTVPLQTKWQTPVPAADLTSDSPIPSVVLGLAEPA